MVNGTLVPYQFPSAAHLLATQPGRPRPMWTPVGSGSRPHDPVVVNTVVWHAFRQRWSEVVATLRGKHGASIINARSTTEGFVGYTLLHWAVAHSQEEVVALALARGADPNVRDAQGRTPVWTSAVTNSPGVFGC